MEHTFPPLPYAHRRTGTRVSRKETLEYHYSKHHNAYVTNLNNLHQRHRVR
jgi:Fe-Mn family superoxide dismutase